MAFTSQRRGDSITKINIHSPGTAGGETSFLIPHLHPDHDILEVGCGSGTTAIPLARQVPSGTVTGVDLPSFDINEAKATPDLPANVKFVEGDILAKLPFPSRTFDVVFSTQLFHALPSKQKMLTEMQRVLKPGGLLATRDVASVHFYPASRFLDQRYTKHLVNGVGVDLVGDFMPQLVGQAGFPVVHVQAGTTLYAGIHGRKRCLDKYMESLAGHVRGGRVQYKFLKDWEMVGIMRHHLELLDHELQEWRESEGA